MKDNITIRRLKDCEEDYKNLEKWCCKKEIYSQFEQRILNYDEIKVKYSLRTKENSKIPVFMIEYNHKPVGIIQYQLIDGNEKKLYNIDFDNIYEIDVFIGELNLHNKGIGKRSIELLSDYLFEKKNAKALIMCPLKNNIKAIKCYQNCGFIKQKDFKANNTVGEFCEYTLMVNK